ncbi:hypothetical protein AB0H77_18930 [Streptomyces sp. NPDC050844]|uniref:hypothetical protein n=1 Tax=Streptomyces sp. NPDC050844 TaxID=3155790 RepID=UPI0033C53005
MRTYRTICTAALSLMLTLLPGSTAAAEDCGTQVWRMTIKEVDIRNGGDSGGGDLYGDLVFDGQYLWSKDRSDAAFVPDGPLAIDTANQWKLWDEKLFPTTGGRNVFVVKADLWDYDSLTLDDRVAVDTYNVDPLGVGEGTHTLDYCYGSACSEGRTVITYVLEQVGECACSAGPQLGRPGGPTAHGPTRTAPPA